MSKLTIKKGKTSKSVDLLIRNTQSSAGDGLTGLLYNTSGISAYYHRQGGTATSITLATLAAANSAFSSGGFKEVDATNMPGLYRFDIPDACLATSAEWCIIIIKGASYMEQVRIEVELVDYNPEDGIRLGLTTLPNAAAEAAGGLYTRGSGAGQINQQTNGQVDGNIERVRNSAINVLVSGRVDGSVGAMAANVLTATAINADAITAAKVAADVSTEINAGVLAVLGALADAAADGDPTSTDTLMAYVKQLVNTLVGTAGIVAWPAAADPANAVSMAEVQRRIFDNLATIAGYIDTEVGAIKTKTDQLTFTGAGKVDASLRDWLGTAPLALASQRVEVNVSAMAAAVITAAAIATDAVDADALKTDAVTEIVDAVWANAARTLTDLGFVLTAAQLANVATALGLTTANLEFLIKSSGGYR